MADDVELKAVIPGARYEQMTALAVACDLPTPEAVINHAITIFAWLVQKRMAGARIAALYDEQERLLELDSDALNRARAFAERHNLTDATSAAANPKPAG